MNLSFDPDRLTTRLFLEADTGASGAGDTSATTAGDGEEFGAGLEEASAELLSQQSDTSAAAPEPAEASAPAAEPTSQPAQAEQQAFSLMSFLRDRGIDYGFQNDQDAAQFTEQTFRLLQQNYDDLQTLKQLKPYLPQFQQFVASQWQQQQQPQQQQTAAEKKRWAEKLEYDPMWRQMVERDPETGKPRVIDGYDPSVLTKLQQFELRRQQIAEQMLTDLPGFFEPMQNETVEMAVEKALAAVQEKFFSPVREHLVANEIYQRDQGWMYATNEQGQRTFTREGQRYFQILQNLDQMGIKNAEQASQMAKHQLQQEMAYWGAYQQPQQAVPGAAPVPTPVANPTVQNNAAKQRLLQQGRQRSPNVSARAQASLHEDPATSLTDMALARLNGN